MELNEEWQQHGVLVVGSSVNLGRGRNKETEIDRLMGRQRESKSQ